MNSVPSLINSLKWIFFEPLATVSYPNFFRFEPTVPVQGAYFVFLKKIQQGHSTLKKRIQFWQEDFSIVSSRCFGKGEDTINGNRSLTEKKTPTLVMHIIVEREKEIPLSIIVSSQDSKWTSPDLKHWKKSSMDLKHRMTRMFSLIRNIFLMMLICPGTHHPRLFTS